MLGERKGRLKVSDGLQEGRYKKRGWHSATPKHTHIKRKEKSFNKRAGSYRGKLEDLGLALKHWKAL